MEKQILEDDIKKMELEVELEERKALQRQEMFVQDLEDQVNQKAEAAEKAKKGGSTLKDVLVWEQKNRDKNELATKLAKISLTEDIGVAVSDFNTFITNGKYAECSQWTTPPRYYHR